MSAPQGELLRIVIDGQERDIQIEPTILSRKSQEALFRVYRRYVRDNTWRDMQELKEAEGLSDETKEEIRQQYASLLNKAAAPSLQNAIEMLNTPDGLIAVLSVCSNLTQEDAMKVVDNQEAYTQVLKAIGDVCNREGDSLKN
jgi:hypothetical protein